MLRLRFQLPRLKNPPLRQVKQPPREAAPSRVARRSVASRWTLHALWGAQGLGECWGFGSGSAVSFLHLCHKATGAALTSFFPNGFGGKSGCGSGTDGAAAAIPARGLDVSRRMVKPPSTLPGPTVLGRLAGMLTWYAAQQDASRFSGFEGELVTRCGVFVLHS